MESQSVLIKEPESLAVIRFQDCDPFGHLNNARYIDYFMNARMDHLAEHYGLSLIQEGRNESWVVSKSQIAFVSPARMAERVRIRTRLINFAECNLVVEGLMLSEDAQRLKAALWIEFTYVSLASGRPVKHTDDLVALFRDVVIQGAYHEGFDQRVTTLRSEFRRA